MQSLPVCVSAANGIARRIARPLTTSPMKSLAVDPGARAATRMTCATATLLAAGALIPSVHHSRVEFYAEQQQVRHVATALALEHGSATVRARWSVAGREHVETIASPHEIAPGDPLPVWVDDKGNQVAVPSSPNRADYDTVVDVVLLFLTSVVAATALVRLA
jgi:hypothetical protein